MSLLREALGLIAEACSGGCLAEECRRLENALDAAGAALRETGGFGLLLVLRVLEGYLEGMIDAALEKGCTREAELLTEARAMLRALS